MMQNLVPALQISTNVKQSKAAVLTKSKCISLVVQC